MEASFDNLRNYNTTAVLLTFNLLEQLCTLYFPGQPPDTAVYKYQDRLMIFHKCHKYGPSKTRCRRKAVCRNCDDDDHISDKTDQCPNEYLSVQTVDNDTWQETKTVKLK